MSHKPRPSSEYSARSESTQTSGSQDVHVTDEEKTQARATLYRAMFKSPMTIVATIPALIGGAIPIVIFFFFGRILNKIVGYSIEESMFLAGMGPTPTDPINSILQDTIMMVCVVILAAIAKFFSTFMWIRVGCMLSVSLKRNLFQTMMKSEITFFDVNPIGGILTMLSEDAQMVQDAFGITKGSQVSNISQFVVGICLAFIYSWEMALASIPIIAIVVFFFIPGVIKESTIRFRYLADAMTIAEETLGTVRTVRGFNKEEDECKRFVKELQSANVHEQRAGYYIVGLIMGIMITTSAMVLCNLYFGGTLIDKSNGSFQVGDLMSCFMFCMFGTMGLTMIQGSMQGESKAVQAGARILKITAHVPSIPFEGGIKPD